MQVCPSAHARRRRRCRHRCLTICPMQCRCRPSFNTIVSAFNAPLRYASLRADPRSLPSCAIVIFIEYISIIGTILFYDFLPIFFVYAYFEMHASIYVNKAIAVLYSKIKITLHQKWRTSRS